MRLFIACAITISAANRNGRSLVASPTKRQ